MNFTDDSIKLISSKLRFFSYSIVQSGFDFI